MKTLVIGSGGREHAIVWHLRKKYPNHKIFAWPGNGGIGQDAKIIESEASLNSLKTIIKNINIDRVIVGPEQYLAEGWIDELEKEDLKVLGPRKKAAQFESSKDFSKSFMLRNSIPTANAVTVDSIQAALQVLKQKNGPVVLKADGLAAGKGVFLPETQAETLRILKALLEDSSLGSAGKKILIEDRIVGEELSYLVFTDGEHFSQMPVAKDFKRLANGDKGPNTGGMGVFSPSALLTSELEQEIIKRIVKPTLEGMHKEGIDYKGVLYFGLFITEEGPKVCEYNVRFGDPETQAVLMRLDTPLLEIADAISEGLLHKLDIKWRDIKTGGVVIASEGYPASYKKNILIDGLGNISDDILIFHAGTSYKDNNFYNSGGRVLNIMAEGNSFMDIFNRIYKAIDKINFPGKTFRTDICPER